MAASKAATENTTTAQTSAAASSTTTQPLIFELATQNAGLRGAQPQLINGIQVNAQPRDWPAVVITPLGQARDMFCTATMVGPGVMIMAAHCLDQGGPDRPLRPAFLKVDGVQVEMNCAVHPDYLADNANSPPAPRHSQDFGLCYAAVPPALPTLHTLSFEQVDISPLSARAPVLMMGYGCTDLDQQAQDRTLRVGNAQIEKPAGPPGDEAAYAQIVSHGPPNPALCPGDSGGPLMTGATAQQQTLARRLRGVNSSIQRAPQGLISRVAMLSYPGFAPWARNFVARFPGAYICGLDPVPAIAKCRV